MKERKSSHNGPSKRGSVANCSLSECGLNHIPIPKEPGPRQAVRIFFLLISIADDSLSFPQYIRALLAELRALRDHGVIDDAFSTRLFRSAIRAYYDRFIGYKK